MSAADFNKRQHERRAQTCKHFNGIQHEACRLGVKYRDVEAKAPPMTGRHLPCLPGRSGACEGECAKREFPTPAEVEAEEAVLRKSIDNTMTARKAIVAKAGPFIKGKSPNIAGEIACPVCSIGKLGFTRAAYNGHIHAACSTPDCVRWME